MLGTTGFRRPAGKNTMMIARPLATPLAALLAALALSTAAGAQTITQGAQVTTED